jgi:hypothetical protein
MEQSLIEKSKFRVFKIRVLKNEKSFIFPYQMPTNSLYYEILHNLRIIGIFVKFFEAISIFLIFSRNLFLKWKTIIFKN